MKKHRKRIGVVLLVVVMLCTAALSVSAEDYDLYSEDGILLTQAQAIFGILPDVMPGSENDTRERIALGEKLYFEEAISINQTQSCNSCHPVDDNGAGADHEVTGLGALGEHGDRNDPTTFNAGFQIAQFWDGREPNLKEQAKGPVLNPVEMAMPDEASVLSVLAEEGYEAEFQTAFGSDEALTYDNFAEAIAAFERTLISKARFDQYLAGDIDALSRLERRGLKAFIDNDCVQCHTGDTLGGKMFQKMGVHHPYQNTDDIGREEVTGNPVDKYVFKVPMLRNITLTAPYFHDGAVASLAEAIDQMAYLQLDRKLSAETIQDMMRFMVALADDKITGSNTVETSSDELWQIPSEEAIENLEGEAKYGYELLTTTNVHPDMEAYSGNDLTCVSCHLDSGTKRFSLPWIGVTEAYPQYRGREDKEVSLEERINGCFERSLNGSELPEDSEQMQAIVTYMGWLSDFQAEEVEGLGTPDFEPPNRKVDLDRGADIYERYCMACHGADGAGYVPLSTADLEFGSKAAAPALWGNGSYNNGAGTNRVLTAAAFIKHSMPLGIDWREPTLNDEDTYDVAGYINAQTRPEMAGLESDYPDLSIKPVDCPYPPYADDFPQEQHQFGPFQPIEEANDQD